MRFDGFFCEYTEADKLSFLSTLHSRGVRNIETESTAFAAITGKAGVRAAIVSVTLLNHMVKEQVTLAGTKKTNYAMRPFKLVSALIRNKLNI